MTAAYGRQRVRVSASLALRRRGHSLAFLLLGVLLGALTAGTAALHNSARDAIASAASANLGDRGYVLETDDTDAQQVLAGLDGVSPILDSSGYLTGTNGTLDTTIRLTDDASLVLGTLVAGEPATSPGDVLVTRGLARTLGISVGDEATLMHDLDSSVPVRVAGIIVDTADAGARTVQLIVDPDAVAAANRWVSDEAYSAYPELEPYVHAYTVVMASSGRVQESALANLPPAVSMLTHVPVVGALLVFVLIFSFAGVLVRTWIRDVDALVAAGLPPSTGWRVIATVVTALTVTGTLLGASLALASTHLARSPISGVLGQDWVAISVPAGVMAAVIVATIALGLVAVPAGRRLATGRRQTGAVIRSSRWRTPMAGFVAAAAAVVVAYALVPWSRDPADDTRALAFFAAIALAASVPFLLSGAIGAGLPRATRRLATNMTAPLATVTAAAIAVAVAASTWSALEFSDAAGGEIAAGFDTPQPAGSLLISAMPEPAIQQLGQRYEQFGGTSITAYELTSDATAALRATRPSIIDCAGQTGETIEALFTCDDPDLREIAIGEPGIGVMASPLLVEDGATGVVSFSPTDWTVLSAVTTAATIDADLGYYMPGIIIGADDPVIEELGVEGSGLSVVLLEDFAELPAMDRLALRSFVLTLSPTAELSDATQPTAYDQIRSTATGVALAGALVTVVMLLLGGGAIVMAQDAARRALIDLGVAPSLRIALALRWAAVPAISLALGAVLTVAVATGGWTRPWAALSWPWAVAYVVGLLATAAITRAYLQPPRRSAE